MFTKTNRNIKYSQNGVCQCIVYVTIVIEEHLLYAFRARGVYPIRFAFNKYGIARHQQESRVCMFNFHN
jgi:hypothetical protein